MRDDDQRARVLALRAAGKSIRTVAAETGVPRATVARWLAEGDAPRLTVVSEPARPTPAPPPEDRRDRPEPDLVHARLDRLAFLEWQLSELLADLEWARRCRAIREIRGLNAEVTSVRQELDMARAETVKVVELDRSPAAVAAEVERRRKALEILAAAGRKERTL